MPPRRRAKKAPLTERHRVSASASSRVTQSIISRYHTLNKQLAALSAADEDRGHGDQKVNSRRQDIQKQLEALGGLPAYQAASLCGQRRDRGGDTSRWLLPRLCGSNDRQAPITVQLLLPGVPRPLRLLDVGALRNNYAHVPRTVSATCIDLHAQSPDIHPVDFMALPMVEQVPTNGQLATATIGGVYDVVCLSLVLNFVPTPLARGQMLLKCRHHVRGAGGLLYIVLPRPCVDNSRYLTTEHFVALLAHCGFTLLDSHRSERLAYFLFTNTGGGSGQETRRQPTPPSLHRKQELNGGAGRNNFAILLPR